MLASIRRNVSARADVTGIGGSRKEFEGFKNTESGVALETKLRVLILEDNPADAELTESALLRGGLEFVARRVDTKETFLRELDGFAPDLVLADYSLPSFGGMAALDICRKHRPDVPFIVVSGVLGEEFAIETLKQGATDFVPKQRLSRLVPVVRRALRESVERVNPDRKQAQEAQEKLIRELQRALVQVKSLKGLLPICSWCKRIRDDKGYWLEVEAYIHEHSEADFSHGICPECMETYKKQHAKRSGRGKETSAAGGSLSP